MRITATAWAAYTQQLAKLNKKAGQLMADYIAAHGTGDTDALIAYAHALVTKYGEGSAELACQMYDALAAAAGRKPARQPSKAGMPSTSTPTATVSTRYGLTGAAPWPGTIRTSTCASTVPLMGTSTNCAG